MAAETEAGRGDGEYRAKYMHEEPLLSKGILSAVRSTVPLEIKESTIGSAGSGLFAAEAVDAGTEIFRSQPLVNCRDPRLGHVCDFCFANAKTTVHRDGRFLKADEMPVTIKGCTGCMVARYCSKVCFVRRRVNFVANLNCPAGLPEDGLEILPQVRVQTAAQNLGPYRRQAGVLPHPDSGEGGKAALRPVAGHRRHEDVLRVAHGERQRGGHPDAGHAGGRAHRRIQVRPAHRLVPHVQGKSPCVPPQRVPDARSCSPTR